MMSRLFVLAALTVLLAACGESSLLTPELSEDERVDIQTVRDGALLAPSAAVPVSISQSAPDGSAPEPLDHVDVVITDIAGASVATNRIEGEPLDTGEIPPVVLPDLEPGGYIISLSAYRGGRILASQERTLFVVPDPDAYAISGIAIYPPSLAPERSGLVQASVSAPEGVRAWLRWRADNPLGNEPFTYSVWVKTSDDYGIIISDLESDGNSFYNSIIVDSGYIRVRLLGDDTDDIVDIDDNTWKHVVLTYDGTDGKVYLDGSYLQDVNVGTITDVGDWI
ncbi:MAG: LamG-like jellyroll fold domain-containing protein, partial [Spirochaetia bacterium]